MSGLLKMSIITPRPNAFKIRYAIMAVADMRGGRDVSLLDEVVYWESDDFWIYAGFAAAACIRATADYRALSVAELSRELRDRN